MRLLVLKIQLPGCWSSLNLQLLVVLRPRLRFVVTNVLHKEIEEVAVDAAVYSVQQLTLLQRVDLRLH